ncbi:S1C family serine protease [Brevibacillus daliensis]|uniref:S1C family serine protease n=1 Tax=Brevibacillus daliensis TaxID=2892995 RepID=UPI001E2C7BA5|nr:S1C family serine protease [Brevibacillus daliensis]
MGYYDDEFYNDKKKKSSQGMGKTIFTSITSAVIGGLVVMMVAPWLTQAGYMNPLSDTTTTSKVTEQHSSSKLAQQVSVEVNTAITKAVDKVDEAVVGIINIQQVSNPWSRESQAVTSGEGSGVIFEKKDGKAHIITNNHVIKGAEKLEVSLISGERIEAKVLGHDERTDIAVLEIDGSKVNKVAELGDSSTLKVGEPVIAIGNPLGMEFSGTVTQGIVSSTNRSMPMDINEDGTVDWELDVIQTDAAINPGNSGGALVNIEGQVVGINTLKISKNGVEGLGFSIPINDVKTIIPALIKDGYLNRAYMGVGPRDLTDVPHYAWKDVLKLPETIQAGVVVMSVGELSPAQQAGVKEYDVITHLDDEQITSGAQLLKYLTQNKKPGDTVDVTLYRDGFKQKVKVKLGESPSQQQQQQQQR